MPIRWYHFLAFFISGFLCSFSTFGQCLSLSTAVEDVSCNGGADGKISLTISPGAFPDAQPPFDIELFFRDSNGELTQLASYDDVGFTTITFTQGNGSLNLPDADEFGIPANDFIDPGSDYRIDVRSNGGLFSCRSKTTFATVQQPTLVSIDGITSANLTCNGASDGQIVVTAVSGGDGGPYSYSIDNGANFQASNTFDGLASATYDVVVRDGGGCTSAATQVVISEPAVVTIDLLTPQDVTCNGANDGQITVITVSGGNGSYEYSIDNGANFQAGNTFSGLAPATYDVVVRDDNGCLSASIQVIIGEPAVVTIDAVTPQDVTCNGANDAQIVVTTVSGGNGSYEYSIDNGSNFQPGNTFSGLAPATYDVVVRDGNGCLSTSTQVIIGEPTVVTIDAVTPQDLTCNGADDGQIVVTTVSGGNGSYEYSIDNGASFQAGNTFSGLAPATYDVVVRDGNECLSASTQVTLNAPAAVTIDAVTPQDLTCNGANDGQIVVTTVSGGNGSYEYSIDNGANFQAGNTFSGLAPATYDVVVRDGNGCLSASTQVIIGEPAVVMIDAVTPEDVTCNGANDGQIVVTTVSGGNGSYEYSIDNGANFQAGNTFSGLAPSTYDVVVRDGNGCLSASTQVVIGEPAVVTINAVTPQDVTCNGANDGQIVVTAVSGGNGSYEYSIDNGANFQPGNTFSGLAPATYDVVVRDGNGCLSTSTQVIIGEPVVVTIDAVTPQALTCNGANDGQIVVTTVSGGNGSYEYSNDNGANFQPGNTFSGLAAGTYDVVVKDGNGCLSLPTQVIINAPAAVTIDLLTPQDVNCNGANDGQIAVTAVSGGNGSYEYSIDNGANFQAGNTFSGLAPATYDVVVRDGNGCLSASTQVTLNEPAAVTIDAMTPQDLTCNAANDGQIVVTTVSGGNGSYEYSIDNGANFQAGNTFSGLAPATYDVVVRDGNGCLSASTQVIVGEPTVVMIDAITPQDVTCNGANDGQIAVTTVSGGNGSYEYSIDNGANFQAGNTFSGLVPATYDVVVRDGNGCLSAPTQVIIGEPAVVTIDAVTPQDLTCNGANDGQIAVDAVSGGNGSYEYSIDNGVNFQAGNTFSGLAPATYDVVVRDGNGCLSLATQVTLNAPAAVTIDAVTPQDLTCNGANDGQIVVTTVSGGNGSYEYSIDNGANFQPGNTFSGLAAGTYDVVVKDGNGCLSLPTQVILNAPAAVTIDLLTPQDVNCNGASDGQIAVTTVSGGNGSYEYSIDNGANFQAGNTFSGLAPATYDVVVRDGNGCLSASTQVIVGEPAVVTIDLLTPQDVTCNGANDGQIVVTTVSGGNGSYEYSIDNGANFQAGNTFSGLAPATYDVVVRDGNLCISSVSQITITEPSTLTVGSINTIDATCNGTNDGLIQVNSVTGGIPPYRYSINGGLSFQVSNSFSDLAPGNYDVLVRDNNGCVSNVTNVTVNALVSISITSTDVTNASCLGVADGAVEVTSVSGGTAPYTYSIDGGATFQQGNNFSGLGAGNYDLIARDNNGCESAAIVVSVGADTQVIIDSHDITDASCEGIEDGSIEITSMSGGVGPHSYSINGGASFQSSNLFSGLANGDYDIVVRDANGCSSAVTTLSVGSITTISIASNKVTDVTCVGSNDGSIEIESLSGGLAPYEYSLDGGAFQTSNIFASLPAGEYDVQVRDKNGCLSSPQPVTVNDAVAVTPVIVGTNVSCSGGDDGSIKISSVSGGVSPYEYSTDGGSTFQSADFFPGLIAGDYNVVVRDAGGCESDTYMITIIDGSLDFGVTATDATCDGNDGSITISVAGGSGSYEYSNDGGATFQASNVFSGQSTGSYLIVVRDALGCKSAPQSVTVSMPPNCGGGGCGIFTVFTVESRPTCANQNDGSITFNVVGGTPTYIFTISDNTGFTQSVPGPGPNFTFSSLSPGNYFYTIEDNAGNICTLPYSLALESYVTATAVKSSFSDAICHGTSTGSAVIQASGSRTGSYYYSIDGANWASFIPGNRIENLPPNGTYFISVGETPGDVCSDTAKVTINNAFAPITVDFDVTPATCNGNDGAITNIAASGGDGGPYTFSIDGGQSFADVTDFNGLMGAAYTLRVRDKIGCEKNFPVNVTFPGFINFNFVDKNADCTDNFGSILVTVPNSNPSVRVGLTTDPSSEPSEDDYRSLDFNSQFLFSSLQGGLYFIFVKSQTSECVTRSGPIDILDFPAIDFDLQISCIDNQISVVLSNITGDPEGPQLQVLVSKKFSTDPPVIINTPFPSSRELYFNPETYPFLQMPGIYQIRMTQTQVLGGGLSGLPCPFSSETVDFVVPEPLTATIGPVKKSYDEVATGELQVRGMSGGERPYDVSIAMTSSQGFSQSKAVDGVQQQLNVVFNPVLAGDYRVTVTDALGCFVEFFPNVERDLELLVPTVFTPNGDNVNDTFEILPMDDRIKRLTIGNRWGKEVFTSENYQNNWDGEGAADGIYFYRLQVGDSDVRTGWVEIVRGPKP